MRALAVACFLVTVPLTRADDPAVTGIKAVHRHGQTFITWKDAAPGEAGSIFRYSLYRSSEPITAKNLDRAQLCYRGVLNNSGRLFGTAFNPKSRLADGPYTILEEGGPPLPAWSGLAVTTALKEGTAYYAVVATDDKHKPLSAVVPGQSATTEAVAEKPAPIRPIKLYDSKERKTYAAQTSITGTRGLPLDVALAGSQAQGGGASDWGDYYLYFGTPDMGFRDGLPGVFSVEEHRRKEGNQLVLKTRDGMEHPAGRNMETYWFGYWCVPQWAEHKEPRVYPFTETRLLWMIRWSMERYAADPRRVTMGGSSSGAVGSMNVGFRHPELFCAVFPIVGRVRRVPAIAFEGNLPRDNQAVMADGKTPYYDHVDGPRFAMARHDELPFLAWACGRNDGYATWAEHIDMVTAMTANKHGFAFAWNDGGHSEGGKAMQQINKYYPRGMFALNKSYPALGNSSIDNVMGPGDPKEGDLEGGINLGFAWTDIVDEDERWSISLANDLAKADMTVDVTPRRCQKFKPKPGSELTWTASTGGSGKVVVDQWGLATVPKVVIQPGKATVLTFGKAR